MKPILRLSALLLLGSALSARATTVYVATNGSAANDGLTPETPLATINAAVAKLGAEGGTILLADGIYPETAVENSFSAVVIEAPVTIESSSRNASACTITRSGGNVRILKLDHPDAIVRNITIRDGLLGGDDYKGGNLYIGLNGGTVEDCILTGGSLSNTSSQNGGGNLFMETGRVARCVLSKGKVGNMRHYASGAFVSGGIFENCLVTGGTTMHHNTASSGDAALVVRGTGKAVNCTVVGNTGCFCAGIWVMGTNARAINCVVYGNKRCNRDSHTDDSALSDFGWTSGTDTTVHSSFETATLAPFFLNCASERGDLPNSSCLTISGTAFADAENADWRLSDDSPLFDAGYAYADSGATSDTDLARETRVLATAVDIGCYEKRTDFFVEASASSHSATLPDDATVTFTATPYFNEGSVTYVWNFGDGTTETTTETTLSHTYASFGSFEVTVTATDSAHAAVTVALAEPIQVSGLSFSFSASPAVVLVGAEVAFRIDSVSVEGAVTYTWDFGDGVSNTTTAASLTHAYAAAGVYTVSVTGTAMGYGTATRTLDSAIEIRPKDLYVRPTGGSNSFPYDTWDRAAARPQTALNVALAGSTVHLAPGIYNLPNLETVVSNAVTLVGEGATPADTVLSGSGGKSRNLRVTDMGARVANITLDGGSVEYAKGGNLFLAAGVVSNCVLRGGRSNSSGGGGGGAHVEGGILTHCVVTNSYLGNRGNGIILNQTGGRVSNCLLGSNKREWISSRNAFSLVCVEGGTNDNCTVADCWILKNNPNKPLQMGNASDKGVYVGPNALAVNLAIADIRWDIFPGDGESLDDLLADIGRPQAWAGTAANFVNCATDDDAPINETCRIGTAATFFKDYAARDLTPKQDGPLFGAGAPVAGAPAVDLAGNPRLSSRIDIGAFEFQLPSGLVIVIR